MKEDRRQEGREGRQLRRGGRRAARTRRGQRGTGEGGACGIQVQDRYAFIHIGRSPRLRRDVGADGRTLAGRQASERLTPLEADEGHDGKDGPRDDVGDGHHPEPVLFDGVDGAGAGRQRLEAPCAVAAFARLVPPAQPHQQPPRDVLDLRTPDTTEGRN